MLFDRVTNGNPQKDKKLINIPLKVEDWKSDYEHKIIFIIEISKWYKTHIVNFI